MVKIEVYLPREFIIPVRDALHAVGAGRVGQYDHCVSVTEVRAVGGGAELPTVANCPFCVRNPEEVLLENDHCAFLIGRDPVLQGSGVIVPKAHRPTVFDLTPEEWSATYWLLAQVRERMVAELQPAGFNIGWNCGETGGQEIFHAHLHVIPRFRDEPFAGKGIRHWLKSEANQRPGR